MKLKLSVFAASLVMANVVSAATAIDLRHESSPAIQKFLPTPKTAFAVNPVQLQEVRVDTDQNQTTHQRVQETYAGIPVWGAAAVIHTRKATPSQGKSLMAATNNTTMNGVIYDGLEKDLAGTPGFALSEAQKQKAMTQAKRRFEQQAGRTVGTYEREEAKQVIFVDDNQTAHYAFYVSFYVDDHVSGAKRPAMILDAESLAVYKSWDRVMTETYQTVGGIGGNKKTTLVHEDADSSPFVMKMQTEIQEFQDQLGRLVMVPVCTFVNDDIEVLDVSYALAPAQAICNPMTDKHNNMNWVSHDANGTRWKSDEMNNGFSPSLDAFYDAVVIKHLYEDWYGIPVLTQEDGKTPLKLRMRVHYGRNYENAFWDGEQMTFGDGGSMFYPLTSLDVGAHEISHGFTEQHSGIGGTDQMAGLHEAFSDMAAAAAEFYTTQKNSWLIGINIAKGENPLRYMDHPSRDGMSIDTMKNYRPGMDEHLLAGIFNRAFHLIANSPGWDTRKAFNVMVKANMHYWNPSMKTFEEAACGVMSATKDYEYNTADVAAAFLKVGIDTGKC